MNDQKKNEIHTENYRDIIERYNVTQHPWKQLLFCKRSTLE